MSADIFASDAAMARLSFTAVQSDHRPVQCPEWCDGVHNKDSAGEFFHRGRIAIASVPEGAAVPTIDKDGNAPLLTAHLVLPAGPEGDEEPAQITVDCGDLWGPYAELDVEQADQFIRDLKTYTARLEQMRDQLAAVKEQQS